MGIKIERETPKPETLPIEAVTLSDQHGYRTVTVRPTSEGLEGGRTVECSGRAGESYFKFVAMLGDLREFGQALIDIADGK